jgi:hypothetical protein
MRLAGESEEKIWSQKRSEVQQMAGRTKSRSGRKNEVQWRKGQRADPGGVEDHGVDATELLEGHEPAAHENRPLHPQQVAPRAHLQSGPKRRQRVLDEESAGQGANC